MTRSFSRFIALDRSQRRLVIEAAALLTLVGAAMSVGGFARSRRLLERCARNRERSRASAPGESALRRVEPSAVAWAVTAAASRFPFRHTCLVKALATDVMLKRRGLPSSIFVGVRRGQIAASIDAHAWVESGGDVVIGALDDLSDFTVTFGGAPLVMPAAASVEEFARILRGEDLTFAAFNRTPDEFMRDCADEDLAGLVHERVSALSDSAGWPLAVRETLERQARDNMASELARRAQVVSVLDALAANGVRPLLFKGTALAYTLYQAPHLRPRLDTDLFIDRADLEAVTRTFVALGYSQPAYCDGELLFGQVMFTKTDALAIDHVFDVHWRASTQSATARLVTFEELSAAAIDVPALGRGARCVGSAHALLLACVHAVVHHRNAERLIWIHDIHLLASRLSPSELEGFVRLANAGRVAAVCAHSLTVSRDRLGTSIPDRLLRQLSEGADDEPSAAYLEPGRSWRHEQVSNIAGLARWTDRLQLAREVLLPSSAYMRKRYGLEPGLLGTIMLPMLYVHRTVRGGLAMIRGRK